MPPHPLSPLPNSLTGGPSALQRGVGIRPRRKRGRGGSSTSGCNLSLAPILMGAKGHSLSPRTGKGQFECFKTRALPSTDAEWEAVVSVLAAYTLHLAEGRTPAGAVLTLRRYAQWWDDIKEGNTSLDFQVDPLTPMGAEGAQQQSGQASAQNPPPSTSGSASQEAVGAPTVGGALQAASGDGAVTVVRRIEFQGGQGQGQGAHGQGQGALLPSTDYYEGHEVLAAKTVMLITKFPGCPFVERARAAAEVAYRTAKANDEHTRRGSVGNLMLYMHWCSSRTAAIAQQGWAASVLDRRQVQWRRWVEPQADLGAVFGMLPP
jgi:hypothetical protein